jgi:stringent starvation protein B
MSDNEILARLRAQTEQLKAKAEGTQEEQLQGYIAHLLAEKLIPEGLFTVVADTQYPGLRGVPWDKLTDPNKVVLKFSRNFSGKDLGVSDGVLGQTLSFGGRSCRVEVPVGAIYRLLRQEKDTMQVWAFREEPHDENQNRNDGDDDDGPKAS